MNAIAAIILAAGESKRMGQPKMLMTWGKTTVLGQVIASIAAAGIEDILVVTGGDQEAVEAEISRLATDSPVRATFNAGYATGGMLSSLQRGLAVLTQSHPGPALASSFGRGEGRERRAALIVLGDQPQVQESLVQHICAAFIATGQALIIPSFQMRRGHPWLAARPLWSEILALPASQTSRDFLDAHSADILYLPIETTGILTDVDTLDDYEHLKPRD